MKAKSLFVAWLMVLVHGACVAASADPSAQLASFANDFHRVLIQRDPNLQYREGVWPRSLPDLSPEANERQRAENEQLLARLRAIPLTELSAGEQTTHRILEWALQHAIEESKHYWLSAVLTPYRSYDYGPLEEIAAEYPLATAQERDGYLAFLEAYAAQLEQRLQRTRGQAELGIRLPKAALDGVVHTYRSLAQEADARYSVAPERLGGLDARAARDYQARVQRIATQRIAPAALRVVEYVDSPAYKNKAPEAVGLHQYPGGREYYRHLVRFHTTLDLTPEEVFAYGEARMRTLLAEMAKVRDELGFKGSHEAFVAKLRADPQLRASSPADLEARFINYVDRIRPHLPKYFARLPKAPYRVRRLDEASEATMTFGYYQAPTPTQPIGEYRYNAGNLDQKSTLEIGPLIYHELVPGHHMQVALGLENEALPPIRRSAFYFTAYGEGWADYAIVLAREMGLLNERYDRYGALTNEAFTVARLVLDVGMNYYGWSLERAQKYFPSVAFVTPEDVITETLRYSTDIPGQALGYRIGQRWFEDVRTRLQRELGDRFDIREFHALVLDAGDQPLSVLQTQVDAYLTTKLRAAR